MFWIRSGLQSLSLSDWLTSPRLLDDASDEDVSSIRDAMLAAVGPQGFRQRQRLQTRIRMASRVEDLWYLRPDVLEAVALEHGEAEARRRMARVSAMFEGLVPSATPGRPAREH